MQNQIRALFVRYPGDANDARVEQGVGNEPASLKFNTHCMQEGFQRLLEGYECLSNQIKKPRKVLHALAETSHYKERVTILGTVPGIGLIVAMELLLALQDMERFRSADQLAHTLG